jgi:hypothetical protein
MRVDELGDVRLITRQPEFGETGSADCASRCP